VVEEQLLVSFVAETLRLLPGELDGEANIVFRPLPTLL
jgi:hypothetical protein